LLREQRVRWGLDCPMRRRNFQNMPGTPNDTVVSCAKMAGPIEMLFDRVVDSGGPKDACVKLTYGSTLAKPGE